MSTQVHWRIPTRVSVKGHEVTNSCGYTSSGIFTWWGCCQGAGFPPGSASAEAGLVPGCCILAVAGTDTTKATHDVVVQEIKRELAGTRAEEGGARVKLKLSFPHLEQAVSFHYEAPQGNVEAIERTSESPYGFLLPAQLLRVLEREGEGVGARLAAAAAVEEPHVTAYLAALRTMVSRYHKVGGGGCGVSCSPDTKG